VREEYLYVTTASDITNRTLYTQIDARLCTERQLCSV